MLVDTHCHLDFDSFDLDRDRILERARHAGVGCMINPGVDVESSRRAVELADRYPEVYAAVGIHPNEALCWSKSVYSHLSRLCSHPKVVAIGEIGLDHYRNRASREQQMEAFKAQLALAAETGKPVIIHSRNASKDDPSAVEDVLEMLAHWQEELGSAPPAHPPAAGVLHSYSGNLDQARRAVQLGFYIGITGPVTFKNGAALREMAAALPVGNLLVETDAPFLAPHPFRGKRNEPAYLKYTLAALAQAKQMAFEDLAEATTQNAQRCFRWQVIP